MPATEYMTAIFPQKRVSAYNRERRAKVLMSCPEKSRKTGELSRTGFVLNCRMVRESEYIFLIGREGPKFYSLPREKQKG
jgi:hypothetical protein